MTAADPREQRVAEAAAVITALAAGRGGLVGISPRKIAHALADARLLATEQEVGTCGRHRRYVTPWEWVPHGDA
ncbi:MAG: hypothetical protein GEU74_12365 [Nitriliruptorales bacterium]|nr:hypothetical protein [Nitriliruptorales bacterium]